MSSFTEKDQEILEQTQNFRKSLLRIFQSKSPEQIVDDKEAFEKALKLTESMDRSIIGVARVRSDDAANQSEKELSRQLALEVLSRSHAEREERAKRRIEKKEGHPPELPNERMTDVKPSELRVGNSNEDLDSFMKRQEDTAG